jgi:hypothetical protein
MIVTLPLPPLTCPHREERELTSIGDTTFSRPLCRTSTSVDLSTEQFYYSACRLHELSRVYGPTQRLRLKAAIGRNHP